MVRPFPQDPGLTAVAIGYRNADMIADAVCPRRPVTPKFKYLKFDFGEGITVPDTRVSRKGAPAEVEFSATEEVAEVEDHGLDDVVPNNDITDAPDGYDPLNHAVMGVTDLVETAREVRVANMFFDAGNYAAANKVTLAGGDKFSDLVNSDPLGVFLDALESCIVRPNEMVMGQPVWAVLQRHPKLVKAMHGNDGGEGIVTVEWLRTQLDLRKIHVGRGWVNGAKKGQAVAKQRIWGKHIALYVNDPLANVQNKRPTFALTGQAGTRTAGQIDEPKLGLNGSVRVRVGERVKELILANDLGYLIKDAVA